MKKFWFLHIRRKRRACLVLHVVLRCDLDATLRLNVQRAYHGTAQRIMTKAKVDNKFRNTRTKHNNNCNDVIGLLMCVTD